MTQSERYGERYAVDASLARGVQIGDGGVQTNIFTTPGAAPPARSAYRHQVRLIAPELLFDRERELALLDDFCTAEGPGGYVWWRAAAWAGKSGLMSWFVLHPPPRTRVVSFFITARYSGQGDWLGYTDIVIEQLAELLDRPMPGYLTDANRTAHLAGLLDDAARACQERGERLVLVVDGLDEDRGVTSGPDAHSIAALLPARPPAGLRVVVAGRPDPPLPTDLPDDHPLRDPAIVRVLGPSAHAQVIRRDAERELKRLLHGTLAEQDLLGLITAAGGGLRGADLAELTGLDVWEIEEELHAVAGRTFTRRASSAALVHRAGPTPDVYLLAHEELQSTALRFLRGARLTAYRARLHAWAATYRDAGWPADTPEYLLRGYFRMLASIDDLAAMVAYGTDAGRHARMRFASGGDAGALAEIATAMDAVLAQAAPDVPAMALLAVHRDVLAEQNANLPPELPELWYRLGQPARAEALAQSFDTPEKRVDALTSLVRQAGRAGDREAALALAARAERLLARALRTGTWRTPLDALAEVRPHVVPLIAEEYVRLTA